MPGTFAVGARSYYGRNITATALPALISYAEVADAAQKNVAGEAARQTAEGVSFKPMALPAASEVGALLAAFNLAHSLSQQAQIKTDRERGDVGLLYPAAQELAVDLCDTVEFFYRKDPVASSLRSKAIRWGVVYFYEPGETPDPVEGPAAPPPQP